MAPLATLSGLGIIRYQPTRSPHLGRSAKPTRREKMEVELIFDFQRGEKPDVYPL